MVDLSSALESGNVQWMVLVAAALGCIHTILGPDHYIPFVMMAKAENWSRLKTCVVTFLCGLGHVGSSVAIGAGLALAGTAVTSLEGSRWEALQEFRGDLSAWFLIGAGAAFFIWGLVRAYRNRPHAHAHVHENGTLHAHGHTHQVDHMHVHPARNKRRSIAPWVLFTIFIFGPCESLVPLMLASWAAGGFGATVLVAGAFSVTTIATIMASVGVLLLGVSKIPLGKLERYSMAAAGAALIFCGVAIKFGL